MLALSSTLAKILPTQPLVAGDRVLARRFPQEQGDKRPCNLAITKRVKVTFTSNTITPAAWAADGRGKDQLLPLPALANAAAFTPLADGRVYIPAGTPVGRTYAERVAGTGYGPADAADEQFFLVAFDCYNALDNPDLVFYRPGKVVKQNFIPDWVSLDAGVQAKVQTVYTCIEGAV